MAIELEWVLLKYDWIARKFENLQADAFLCGGCIFACFWLRE